MEAQKQQKEITLRLVMQVVYQVICYAKQRMEAELGFGKKE